jgi:translocation and assembly module TamA
MRRPALRQLVERFSDLQRYRGVSDLDAFELERLMALAGRNARELLGTEGYFAPGVQVRREALAGGRPTVVVAIEPGPATTVRQVDVDFAGDIAHDADAGAQAQRAAITAGWSLPAGRRFTQQRWSDAKTGALRQLLAQRYPRGRIAASQADVDAPAAQARLRVQLDSGPLFRLGTARVLGASRYPPELAERLSWLRAGDAYDQKALVDAQQRLVESGYYDGASITIDPEGDAAAAPVTYTVTEAKRHKLQLGVGYSTDSGPRLSLEHRDNTTFGTSWRSDTTLQLDRKAPLLQPLHSLPDADHWRTALFARHMRQDDGALVTTSQTLRAGRPQSGPRFDRNVYLQYEQANVTGAGQRGRARRAGGRRRRAQPNAAWTGRFFDSPTLPTRGHGLSGEIGVGVTTMGVRKPFTRLTGRWLDIVPVGAGGSRLALRAEGGAVIGARQARLPATQLFRTGGDATVRGYAYRSIGIPLGGNRVGPGRVMALGSVEWQRPIAQQRWPGLLEHVLFVDVGGGRHASDLRAHWGVGTGLRLITRRPDGAGCGLWPAVARVSPAHARGVQLLMAAAPPPSTPTDTPDSIAGRAHSTPANGPSTQNRHPVRHRPWRRAARAAALGTCWCWPCWPAPPAGWHWAGSEGSLASTLRWVGALAAGQPAGQRLAAARRPRGASWVAAGRPARADRRRTLRWTPAALLRRTLHIQQLAATRVQVDDQRPPSHRPARRRPRSACRCGCASTPCGSMNWPGRPPALTVRDLAGAYAFDGARHTLELSRARFQDGRYRARATLAAQAPMALELALAGALGTGFRAAAPAAPACRRACTASLADLQAQAVALAAADAATLPALPTPAPRWPCPPTPTARRLAERPHHPGPPSPARGPRAPAGHRRAPWPGAPRTQLSGQAELAPVAARRLAHRRRAAQRRRRPLGPPAPTRRIPASPRPVAGRRRHPGSPAGPPGRRHAAGQRALGQRRRCTLADRRARRRHRPRPPARPAGGRALGGTAQVQGQGAALDFTLALQARPAPAAATTSGSGLRALTCALPTRAAAGPKAGSRCSSWTRAGSAQLAGQARLHLADLTPPAAAPTSPWTPRPAGPRAGRAGRHARPGPGTAGRQRRRAHPGLGTNPARRRPAAGRPAGPGQRHAAGALARRLARPRAARPPERPQPAGPARRTRRPGSRRAPNSRSTAGWPRPRRPCAARCTSPRQLELQAAAELARTTPKATLAASGWRVQVRQPAGPGARPGAGRRRVAAGQPQAFTLQGVAAARGPLRCRPARSR